MVFRSALVPGDDRTPDKNKLMAPGVPEVLGGRFPKVEPVSLPASVIAPDKRDFVIRETVEASAKELTKSKEELAQAEMDSAR